MSRTGCPTLNSYFHFLIPTGRQIWFLTFRENISLSVFGNVKRKCVGGSRWTVHRPKRYGLYSNVFLSVYNYQWAWHITNTRVKNTGIWCFGRTVWRQRDTGTWRRGYEDNINTDFTKLDEVTWLRIGKKWLPLYEHVNKHSGYTKRWKFFDEISNYQLFHSLCRIPRYCFNKFTQNLVNTLRITPQCKKKNPGKHESPANGVAVRPLSASCWCIAIMT
jgi:hypothetical protein